MTSHLTTFAAETSGSGLEALGVDAKAFLIQLITFGLVFLVLKRYAFKPILKVLQERREMIESGVKLGEEMKKERAKLQAEVEKRLVEARQAADSVIAGAQEAARQTVREAEDKAREKAAGILDQADARIAQDTVRARQTLKKELVGLVADATEVIIHEKVDTKKDAQLIEQALKGRA